MNNGSSTESGPTGPPTTQESIVEKTAEIAHSMHMETWQLVAILAGKVLLPFAIFWSY